MSWDFCMTVDAGGPHRLQLGGNLTTREAPDALGGGADTDWLIDWLARADKALPLDGGAS